MKKFLLLAGIALIPSMNHLSAQFWAVQNSNFAPSSVGVMSISIVDANTVWSAMRDGSGNNTPYKNYSKSINGGSSWTSGTVNVGTANSSIANISGVSATRAAVALYDNTTGAGGIALTNDGGSTWTFQKQLNSSTTWVNFAHYFDANNGIVAGDPASGYFEFYTTSNGGSTWTRVPSANIPAPGIDEYGYNNGFYTAGNSIFMVTNQGRILRSNDKGLTWTVALASGVVLTDFGSATESGDMAWKDSNNGIVAKNSPDLSFYKTLDGGNTWTPVTYTGIPSSTGISDIAYVPGTNILVATSANPLGSWKSYDNGATWISLNSTVQQLSVRCLDANICYSGTFQVSPTAGGMLKSIQSLLGTSEIAPKSIETSLKVAKSDSSYKIISQTGIKSYTIYDSAGVIVKSGKSDNFTLQGVPYGVYVIKVRDLNNTLSSTRLIKN